MININRILCPIDFSAFSEHALKYAMILAARYNAKLQVAHVMQLLPPSSVNELAAASRTLSKKNLNAMIERCRVSGTDVSAALVESAEPAARILELADSFNADLIVTGSHGRTGYQRVLVGSVVEALLHRSPRPILTIPSHLEARPGAASAFSRIVCAVDFNPASLNALVQALVLAEEADGHLTAFHVVDMPAELNHQPQTGSDIAGIRAEAEAACRARLRSLIPKEAKGYCAIDVEVLEGGVSRQILRMAADRHADLIVLGVHGRSVFDLAFFGSNSRDIIRQAHCPVLTVPVTRRLGSLKTAS